MVNELIIPGRKSFPIQRGSIDMGTKRTSPLLKTHSVPISVRRYYTDVNGTLIDKAVAPVGLKVQFPFYVWGLFDYKGAYANSLRAMPVTPGTFYLMTFVEGLNMTSQQITGFTGTNDLRKNIKTGDVVHVFTDNLTAPNYFVWIVQTSKNGSIGAILSNTDTTQNDGKIGSLYADYFQYFADSMDVQWAVPLHFIRSSNISSYSDNQIQPYMYKNPFTEQEKFVKIDCQFNIDQYQSIGTYFDFATNEILLNFLIKTAE